MVSFEQNRLRSRRDAVIGDAFARFARFFAQFRRMRHVQAEKHGMMLFDDFQQSGRQAHRQDDGRFRADANHLDAFDFP